MANDYFSFAMRFFARFDCFCLAFFFRYTSCYFFFFLPSFALSSVSKTRLCFSVAAFVYVQGVHFGGSANIETIRICGILQRIAFGYLLWAIFELALPVSNLFLFFKKEQMTLIELIFF